MSFLNPLLLFGMAAVSVPIIIHLWNRRRFKKVVWAAMRFVQISVEKNKKRMDLEDMILLALRCLLLLLLALALARPAFRDSAAGAFGVAKVTAVVLLDNSGSMGMSDGVETRFEQGRKAAEQIINSLPSGSSVAVYLASDTAKPLLGEPTHDLNLARKVIREARLSDRGTEMYQPLERAVETLKGRAAIQKEIYVITDGQASGWKQLGDIQTLLTRAGDVGKKENLQTHLILVGRREERNLGISDLALATGLSPINRPLRFEVSVANTGTLKVDNVKVSIAVDDEAAADSVVIPEIPPGQTRTASLFVRLRSEGWHSVTVKIGQDALPFDDQRVLAVRGIKELSALLVDGDPGDEPRAAETFFIRHAMTPVPFAEKADYFIKPRAVVVSELSGVRFDDYDVVVLANVAEITVAQSQLLERFVRRGGGLLVFPGPRTNPTFYNERLVRDLQLLPATIGEVVGNENEDDKFVHFQSKNYDHPIISLWRNQSSGTIASARFYKYFQLLPVIDGNSSTNQTDAAKVVLRFDDESPAVVEKAYGLGRVVQFASTGDIAWNDLPVRPAVVPLLHRILAAVTRNRDQSANLPVGQPFIRRLHAERIGQDASVVNPAHEGDERDLEKIAMIEGNPGVAYARTDQSGIYEVNLTDPVESVKFATQSNPAESGLTELTESDLEEIRRVASVVRFNPLTDLRKLVETKRVGAEFWLPLVILVLLLAGGETFLAQYFSRSK
ncbi:MAG: BatA domain-containing protein [Limisphaerales bacterium]